MMLKLLPLFLLALMATTVSAGSGCGCRRRLLEGVPHHDAATMDEFNRMMLDGPFEWCGAFPCGCEVCAELEFSTTDLADCMNAIQDVVSYAQDIREFAACGTPPEREISEFFMNIFDEICERYHHLDLDEYIKRSCTVLDECYRPLYPDVLDKDWFDAKSCFVPRPGRMLPLSEIPAGEITDPQLLALECASDLLVDWVFEDSSTAITRNSQDMFNAWTRVQTDNCFENTANTDLCDIMAECVDPCDQNLNFCEAFGSTENGEKICSPEGLLCFEDHCLDATDNYIFKDLQWWPNSEFPSIACGEGDPHFQTWGGEWYDFHGGCDLVLTHAPNFQNGLGLDVHIRTEIRYQYSYIEAAAVKLGDDIFEVGSFGEWALNGVDSAYLTGATVGGFPLHHRQKEDKHHIFDIVIAPGQNITLSTFKDLVAFKSTNVNPMHYFGSTGLLGVYDRKGAMMSRDGKTDLKEDPDTFGMEWQVRSDEPQLFRSSKAPQYPETCQMPSLKEKRRRLGESAVSEEDAQEACAHWGEKKDICAYDVMVTSDLDIAKAGPF